MANASTLGSMSPELSRVVERAQREPEGRFHSLAHLIDVPALRRAYERMRKGRRPTWFPFTMQIYVSGHEWLARCMRRLRLAFDYVDNVFFSIARRSCRGSEAVAVASPFGWPYEHVRGRVQGGSRAA